MSAPINDSIVQGRIRQILIAITLVAAEAAMLAAIWDFPKWVLFVSAILQLAAAGSLYFYADLPRINLGWVLFSIFLTTNLTIVGGGIYDRLFTDPRLAPFAENSRFFTDLPSDETATFTMICYPFDTETPSSCEIALLYQTALGKFWKPGEFIFDQGLPNFKGISILYNASYGAAASASALRLRQHFRSLSIEPEVRPADANIKLDGSNDFAVWIGTRP